jgi:hypothetical protein
MSTDNSSNQRGGRKSYQEQAQIITPEQAAQFDGMTSAQALAMAPESLRLYRAYLNAKMQSAIPSRSYTPQEVKPIQFGRLPSTTGEWVENPNVCQVSLLEIRSNARRKPEIRIGRYEDGSVRVKTDGFTYLPLSAIGLTKDGQLTMTVAHKLSADDSKFFNSYLKSKFVKPSANVTTVTTVESSGDESTETVSETVEASITAPTKSNAPTAASIKVALMKAKIATTAENMDIVTQLTTGDGAVTLAEAIKSLGAQ